MKKKRSQFVGMAVARAETYQIPKSIQLYVHICFMDYTSQLLFSDFNVNT